MRHLAILLLASLCALSAAYAADSKTALAMIVDFPDGKIAGNLPDVLKRHVDPDSGTIRGVIDAAAVIDEFFRAARAQAGGNQADYRNAGVILHIVKWVPNKDPKAVAALSVASSNWYAYNPKGKWTDADVRTNKRFYGFSQIYVLAIHLDAPTDVKSAYEYRVKHRLPANIQNLVDLIQGVVPGNVEKAVPPQQTTWALGVVSDANPPSDVLLTGAVVTAEKRVPTDKTEIAFDNEGFYRWDISIGVPIKTYDQLKGVVGDAGQSLQTKVDKRDLMAFANLFLKPVDLKDAKFLATPHLVGGVALASKPLHAAFAGLGWGPAITNFYIGAMIVTDNLPNHKTATHVKLGFGLNVPLRTMAAKLGLKSQI
jgi:hypothetical protein